MDLEAARHLVTERLGGRTTADVDVTVGIVPAGRLRVHVHVHSKDPVNM